jgi:putative addiction module component (TIGR02574 family)
MNMTMLEQIAERVERLPEFRRREVLDFIAFMENQDAEEDMGAEWNSELDRRIREIEEGRAKGLPAEAVVREMRAKYG